jgi:hypothetical protein
MKIHLTRESSWMIFAMLQQPNLLNPARPEEVQIYKASDIAIGLEIMSLNKFVNSKLLIRKEGSNTLDFAAYDGPLNDVLTKRLAVVLKHYEPVAMLSTNVQAAMELQYALEGKDVSKDIPSWE